MNSLLTPPLPLPARSTRPPDGLSPALSTPPPPERFGLPAAYRQQTAAFTHDDISPGEYWNADRLAASGKYQYHVYRWAAELVRERGLASVLDAGCGPATKLSRLVAPVCGDIEGIDQISGVEAARRLNAPGKFTPIDLERPTVAPWRTFDLIICSDVVEHLLDPDPMMRFLRGFCNARTLLLFSTPDRARLHGRDCLASTKPEHVREWTYPEFRRFLNSRGFPMLQRRFFPADDSPTRTLRRLDLAWRLRLRATSPHRCQTLLCHAAEVGESWGEGMGA